MDANALLYALGRLEEIATVPRDPQERAELLSALQALRSLIPGKESPESA